MTLRIIHVGLGGWGGDWARRAIPPVPGIEVAVGQDFRSGDTMDRNAALPDDLQGQTAEQFTCQETAAG